MASSEENESDSAIAARISVEIRLRAVTEVREGPPAVEVAERYGVTRQAGTAWRERYESAGLDASPTDPADPTPPQLASTPTKKH